MGSADHAIASVNDATLDNWQNVTLYSLARDIWPRASMAPSDFINLVEKNDSLALYSPDGFAGNFLFVEEPLGGLSFKMIKGIWNAHAPPGAAATK